jgi:Protein of unknown function (DUF3515)
VNSVRGRAALIATAVAIPVAVLLAFALNSAALRARHADASGPPASAAPTTPARTSLPPLAVPVPPARESAAAPCRALVAELPSAVRDLAGRPVRPATPTVRAWGEPAVVLRCGVPRPAGYSLTAKNLFGINGVTWYVQQLKDRAVFTAVDRSVYVEVSVPARYDSAPVAALSTVVGQALAAVPVDGTR